MATFTFNPKNLTRRALIFFTALTCALAAALFFANTSYASTIGSDLSDGNGGSNNPTGGGGGSSGGSSGGGSSTGSNGGGSGSGGNGGNGGSGGAPGPAGCTTGNFDVGYGPENCWTIRSYSGAYGVTDGTVVQTGNFSQRVHALVDLGKSRCLGTPRQREVNAGFTFSATFNVNLYSGQYNRTSWSVNCAPLSYTDVTVKCYIDTSAVLNKITAPKKTIATGGGDISGTGVNEYEACRNVRTARIAMRTTVTDPGRYQLDLAIRYRVNKYRIFGVNSITGRVAKPVRKSRGAVQTVTKRTYGQRTCDPATTRTGTVRSQVFVGNPSWTHDDCLTSSSNPSRFEVKCSPTGRTKINGVNRRTASIFRDGEDNSVVWAKPGIDATTRGVLTKETKFLRTGSPWDTPKNLSSKKNNVILRDSKGASIFTRDKGTGWVGGLIYDTDFSSTWASHEGDPTKITPTYRWAGEFAITGWRITGFNPLTGVMSIRDTVTYTPSSVMCTGDTVSITSLRGVDAIG